MNAGRRCEDPFRIVFVCTGNRARSPLAQALFETYTTGLDVSARSFGTLDVPGAPALPEAVTAGRRLGADLAAHVSRSLRDADLSQADLVLGFEPQHVRTAVVDARANIARTFLLAELVPLLDVPVTSDDLCASARFVVSVADSRRDRMRPDPSRTISDPYGRPEKEMQRIAEEVDRLVREVVRGLFGVVAAPARSPV